MYFTLYSSIWLQKRTITLYYFSCDEMYVNITFCRSVHNEIGDTEWMWTKIHIYAMFPLYDKWNNVCCC